MTNNERIQANNAELRKCIEMAENLPDAGGLEVIEFPTGEAGVYKHGTNFTELLYSWDEIFTGNTQPDDILGYENCIYESAGWLNGVVGGDVILPEHYEGDLGTPNIMSLSCGNVVIPETYGSGNVFDFKNDRPDSTIDCNLEILYLKQTNPSIIYPPYAEDIPNLKKIVVPKGCANIYKSATNWCDYAEIIVEEGTVIGDDGVVGKSLAAKIIDQDQITEVTATDLQGLTKIPMETFSIMGIFSFQDSMGTYYYDTIEKITLPETVTEIASNGISYVPKLNSLTVLAKTPPTLGGSINGNGGGYTAPIYVPAASVDLYKAATNWSNYDIQAIV